MKNEFENKLRDLLNEYSKDNDCNTPDFMLAGFLASCLDLFRITMKARDAFSGVDNKTFIPEDADSKVFYTVEDMWRMYRMTCGGSISLADDKKRFDTFLAKISYQ